MVTGDGALHPDTKSRKITKKAKIERTFINGHSGSHDQQVVDIGYSMMIMIIDSFHLHIDSPVGQDFCQQTAMAGLYMILTGREHTSGHGPRRVGFPTRTCFVVRNERPVIFANPRGRTTHLGVAGVRSGRGSP